MLAAWRAEGVGTGLVVRVPGRLPGLYLIDTDADGQRRFYYWRDSAPARLLFDLPQTPEIAAALGRYDLVYLSGVTLSLYGEAGRARLLEALDLRPRPRRPHRLRHQFPHPRLAGPGAGQGRLPRGSRARRHRARLDRGPRAAVRRGRRGRAADRAIRVSRWCSSWREPAVRIFHGRRASRPLPPSPCATSSTPRPPATASPPPIWRRALPAPSRPTAARCGPSPRRRRRAPPRRDHPALGHAGRRCACRALGGHAHDHRRKRERPRRRRAQLEDILRAAPVIPVITIERAEDAVPLARALVAGGLKALEITLRTPAALGRRRRHRQGGAGGASSASARC